MNVSETTEARAKEVRSVVEKLITLGKRFYSRRNAAKTLRNVEILNEDESTQTALQNYSVKSLNVIMNVKVVYTRILKVGPRRGDGAESVIIELV